MDGVKPSFCHCEPASGELSVNARRFLGSALLVLGLFLYPPFFHAAAAKTWIVTSQPAPLVNGSPVLFRVNPPRTLSALQGKWLDHQVSFRRSAGCDCWYALAGVALNTKPGKYKLDLQGTAKNGVEVRFSQTVIIGAGRYPTTKISVAPEYVEPPKETLARIELEQGVKKQSFAETAPEALWSGGFQDPAEASVSGVFGSARLFNGVKRNQHTGLDFRVATGTPIHAANSGKVVLARNLYFEGNCVAIDHGQGLITLYLHLSEFKVKEGDQVAKGQPIGLSGGTGRATAPHLHFAVRWQGTYLDPAKLLKLIPPS
jgi:Peptidase family M23